MAKTPKAKRREVSVHSRAARRGSSPPAQVPAAKAQVEGSDHKPWLHGVQNAGVGKRKKNKPLSRQQNLRAQRALLKADTTVDKLERKVADSKARGKKVQARRRDWEELNGANAGERKPSKGKTHSPDDSSNANSTKAASRLEGVPLLDTEQPLPLRVTEEECERPATGPHGAGAWATAEDLDEIT